MKNILKSIMIQSSYNPFLRKYAKSMLVYFPKLKGKLIAIRDRDSSYFSTNTLIKKPTYTSDVLNTIKNEIEKKVKEGNKI